MRTLFVVWAVELTNVSWSSDYCSLNVHVSSLEVIYQKIVRARMIADKSPSPTCGGPACRVII